MWYLCAIPVTNNTIVLLARIENSGNNAGRAHGQRVATAKEMKPNMQLAATCHPYSPHTPDKINERHVRSTFFTQLLGTIPPAVAPTTRAHFESPTKGSVSSVSRPAIYRTTREICSIFKPSILFWALAGPDMTLSVPHQRHLNRRQFTQTRIRSLQYSRRLSTIARTN